jgi:hypothetical protein
MNKILEFFFNYYYLLVAKKEDQQPFDLFDWNHHQLPEY